ncbi:MAG: alanine racemase [Gemmatimonadaceae bacterium]
MHSPLRRAWVDIDLGALRRNGATITAHAGRPLLAVVKANAYGLGAVEVTRALEQLSPAPWGYGVATVDEGIVLRGSGIERPILLLAPLAGDELEAARDARLTPGLGEAGEIAAWSGLGGGRWHLAVDTGMNRAGAHWNSLNSLRDTIDQSSQPSGAFTHFHSADRNDGSAEEQERRFSKAIEALGSRPALLHAENSAALVRRRGSRWDLVRPGLFLYGAGPGDGALISPEPVVHLRARVVAVRTVGSGETVSYGASYRADGDRRIATLAMGYAEGYPRSLSNRGEAVVGGRRVPVVGTVTMDMTMVDVTDVPCAAGDVATLLGRHDRVVLEIDRVAERAGTISYELLTGLTGHVEHVYEG